MEIFWCTVFRGWCKISVLKVGFGQKRGFRKKMCTFFLGSLGFTSLLLHDVTRCFRRVCKKPYKKCVFLSTLLLDAEETEKRKKKRPKKSNTHFGGGGLENGQGVAPPFFSNKSGFSKSSKIPIFVAFPEKLVGNHFFQKGYVTKRTDLEGKN